MQTSGQFNNSGRSSLITGYERANTNVRFTLHKTNTLQRSRYGESIFDGNQFVDFYHTNDLTYIPNKIKNERLKQLIFNQL